MTFISVIRALAVEHCSDVFTVVILSKFENECKCVTCTFKTLPCDFSRLSYDFLSFYLFIYFIIVVIESHTTHGQ